ncbi:uncharacterized protein [Fopius arisanus]|uniref:Adipose-secreted signaling protein n=1 Tax=Fopius arisanus TaxID=64838 RepID=A0A0C9QQ33_9HYME|nr:PREDICTED: uncharacterized protein LOC105272045 isoform X2 [Fopius arisanus]
MGDKEHHVHFSGGSGLTFNNIMIQPQRHGFLDAHLGFLQLHHRYHMEFSIPWNTCIHNENKTKPAAVIEDTGNPNCKIIDFTVEKDDLKLKVELLAYQEFLKEAVRVKCCESGAPLTVTLKARVLGKDKGTPVLKNGVRSIAIEADDDDDLSD